MTVAFLVVLAGAWLAVFLPAIVRARKTSAMSTSERWRRRMELIAPRRPQTHPAGRWIVVPESRVDLGRESFKRGQRTRRRILEAMIGACLGSLGAALALHDRAWEVQLACDASLLLYCALLVQAKRRRQQRVRKVRPIGRGRPRHRYSDQVAWLGPRAADDRH